MELKSKKLTNFVDSVAKEGFVIYYAVIQYEEVNHMYTKKAERRGRIALARLALQEEKPLPKIKAEIQGLIDATWEAPSPELLKLFPEGKPTPALFVGTLAKQVSELNVLQHSSS